jgi:hypothetical protein
VKKYVRAVLLSSDKGVLLKDFCKDYCKLVGKQLPYKELGFLSCEAMVWAMPECVTVVATETDQLKLYGRGDGMSFMTRAAKKAQKPKERHEVLSGCRIRNKARRQSDGWKPTEKHTAINSGFASANDKESSPSVDSLQLRLQELERRQSVLKANLKSLERRPIDDRNLSAGQVTSKRAVMQRVELLKATVARKKADLETSRKQSSDLRKHYHECYWALI